MLEMLIGLLLGVHIVVLVSAPHTRNYRLQKRLALTSGLLIVLLSGMVSHRPAQIGVVPALLIALPASQAGVFAALWSCQYSFRRAVRLWRFCFSTKQYPLIHIVFIVIAAFCEESIWRQELQSILGGGLIAVTFTSVVFYFSHVGVSRKIRIPRVIDIFSFSLLVGMVYHWTNSLTAAVATHSIRNIQLFGLRYARDGKFHSAMDETAFLARRRLVHSFGIGRQMILQRRTRTKRAAQDARSCLLVR